MKPKSDVRHGKLRQIAAAGAVVLAVGGLLAPVSTAPAPVNTTVTFAASAKPGGGGGGGNTGN